MCTEVTKVPQLYQGKPMALFRLSHAETSRTRIVPHQKKARPSVEQLIAELQQTAATLEANVQAELATSRTKDPSDAAYSMLARSLVARLNNVRSSIAALEACSLAGSTAA